MQTRAALREEAGPSPAAARRPRIPHLPAIDGLRALAALYVLVYHVFQISGQGLRHLPVLRSFIQSGTVGVEPFFVMSGFVLFLPVVANGGSLGNLKNWAIRRAARIVPAYWLNLLVVVLVFSLPGFAFPPSRQGWLNLAVHMTFLQGFFVFAHNEVFRWWLPDGVIWTLVIDVGFYLVLPFVARWYHKHPFVGLALALIVASDWKWLATHITSTMGWAGAAHWGPTTKAVWSIGLLQMLPTYLGHFALGMTAAWLFLRLREHPRRREIGWAAPVVAAGAAAAWLLLLYAKGVQALAGRAGAFDQWSRNGGVAVAFSVLLLALLLSPRWVQWPVANRAARALGEVSYGIYLFHQLALYFALRYLGYATNGSTQAFLRMASFTLGVGVVAGTISYFVVERPVRNWAGRYTRRPAKRQPRRVLVTVPVLVTGAGAGFGSDGNGVGHANGRVPEPVPVAVPLAMTTRRL